VALLHRGRIVRLGMPEEAITAESLREVYGVDVAACPPSASLRPARSTTMRGGPEVMLRHVLSSSRYLVVIAVASTLLGSAALLLYGAVQIAAVVVRTARAGSVSSSGAKALALGVIEAADVFLISIVLFIIAQGLYALFVSDTLPLPQWLEIHNLDDLKAKLISVVIAVLAVLFLGEVVKWDGERELAGLGAGIALVIAALTYFLSQKTGKKD
jgi:uncharacterized membrane protein YqhA